MGTTHGQQRTTRLEGLAAKENCTKLAAKAKRYAEILVEENDLMTGLSLLKCDDLFLENKAGMAKFHIQLMRENIMKRSPSPPPKGHGTMGNINQEVLKHPDNRQEVLKPPDDTASFFSDMSDGKSTNSTE